MLKNKIKLLFFSMAVIFGLLTGMILGQNNANASSLCGICDYDPRLELSFCNTAYGGSQCGGNNGQQCGSVPCSPGGSG